MPPIVGADYEGGLRPGTGNVPAIVGLGEAARLARERLPGAEKHLRRMRDLLHRLLNERALGALRLSVGVSTTEEEIRHAAQALIAATRHASTVA